MGKIKSIKSIGKQPVYNMTVDDVHNYMIQGNVIVKNCDALRYFCVYWTTGAELDSEKKRRKWRADQYEDYENASEADKIQLIEMWGEPM